MRLFFAILIIIVGVVGIFLPIVPGIMLVAFGVYLINPDWIKARFKKLKSRWK